MYNPALVEPGVKYFMNETLKNCNMFKEQYYNLIFNILCLIFFLLILGTFLYYRYKGRLSPIELKKKDIKKQQYIMSMIRNYHASKKVGNITGLPEFSHENDIIY